MYFPFSAFLGHAVARRALLCTLVDPTLRGVILSGPTGTGKSSLMRSFGSFARAHVEPDLPFIQVPLGISDERLIGGIDLDLALGSGQRHEKEGLIAGADRGYLFVDDFPLLDDLAASTIVQALGSGVINCEREGISRCDLARFVLLATSVPGERELAIDRADRLAFLIAEERRISQDAALLLLDRLDRFLTNPAEFYREYEAREQELGAQVITARILHGLIPIDDRTIEAMTLAALKLNVTGNRADIFAVKAARAHAAMRGGNRIEEGDLKFAIATVLRPRAENVPDESAPSDEEQSMPPEPDQRGGSGQGEGRGNSGSESEEESEGSREAGEGSGGSDREELLDAVDFKGPLVDLGDFFRTDRSTSSGSRGNSNQWSRGRHTRSLPAELRGRRIAVGATLRAAAPHQKGRRTGEEKRVIVRAEDIRVKKFIERAGTLFIFCVDASGSMAINRMREAKGAVTRLLQEAYVNRDTVALISCRGSEADILLPPTNSVERAKRSLDVLPTGGGTPLASALLKAYAMVAQERRRGIDQTLVVFLTDGRANVPLAESAAGMIMEVRRRHVRSELENLAVTYRREAVRSLVIDTRQSFGATSEAVRLAEMLGGEYYYLPQIDARELASVVRAIAER